MAERSDPYGGFRFAVELDGLTRAGFRECSGLGTSQNAVDYREGTDPHLSHRKQPGLVTHTDVTLSRGLTNDDKLWKWRERVAGGAAERHHVTISLLDVTGTAKIRWNLFEAWPSTWTGPSLNATSDEVAVEALTLVYERIEVDEWT